MRLREFQNVSIRNGVIETTGHNEFWNVSKCKKGMQLMDIMNFEDFNTKQANGLQYITLESREYI
jgi:hypothetical protein